MSIMVGLSKYIGWGWDGMCDERSSMFFPLLPIIAPIGMDITKYHVPFFYPVFFFPFLFFLFKIFYGT